MHLDLVMVVNLYVGMCMGALQECAVYVGCHSLSWLDQLRVVMMIMVYACVHDADPLSPYSSDHSFTRQNISMVTASLEDDELADDILQVPDSIQRKIREKTSTSADFREGAIEYYIQYSPQATWAELAGQLYFKECGEAMAAARRFIKRTPGRCPFSNANCVYGLVVQINYTNYGAIKYSLFLWMVISLSINQWDVNLVAM